jgi:hypothetical protein
LAGTSTARIVQQKLTLTSILVLGRGENIGLQMLVKKLPSGVKGIGRLEDGTWYCHSHRAIACACGP